MRVAFLLLLLTCYSFASGSVYYLSPQGDDLKGNGSQTNPWFTLEKAWRAASAGDTILLRGGTYAYLTMQDLTGKNGLPGKPIKIWASPGEKPVITKGAAFDMLNQSNLIYIEADYLHFKGLEISNFAQKSGMRASAALFCHTSNSVFESLNYHHNGGGMIIRGLSTGNLILNCDFHHNFDPFSSEPYNDADGLDIAWISEGTVNTVKGCRFYDNADDGLDLWNNEGIVVIESCWAWHNGYREDGVTIGGDGVGFKLGQTTTTDYSAYKRVLTNNLSVSNRNFGISQNGATCKMLICNNVLYANEKAGIYFSPAWGDASHLIRNNISYNNAINAYINIKLPVIDHNSWQPGVTVTDQDFKSVDPSQLVRPRKSNGNLPDIDFMHLTSSSDMINAGIDVGLPYLGGKPDLGAFETSPIPPAASNQPPVVSISSPVKGISFTTPATVIIDVEASDPDGSITKVELFNGTVKLYEQTAAPYSFTLKDLTAGSYDLKAVATDNMNASSTSSSLAITVAGYIDARDYFNLYPNPNDGRFSIDFTSLLDADIFTITVVDLIGNTVHREELSNNESTRQFDLSYLNSGIYVLILSANQILLTQKFIKR